MFRIIFRRFVVMLIFTCIIFGLTANASAKSPIRLFVRNVGAEAFKVKVGFKVEFKNGRMDSGQSAEFYDENGESIDGVVSYPWLRPGETIQNVIDYDDEEIRSMTIDIRAEDYPDGCTSGTSIPSDFTSYFSYKGEGPYDVDLADWCN